MTETGALEQVIALFEDNCAAFLRLVAHADEAADAVDFTGRMHDLSLTAGRVLGLAAALVAFTGDDAWQARADATLRPYLNAPTAGEGETADGEVPE